MYEKEWLLKMQKKPNLKKACRTGIRNSEGKQKAGRGKIIYVLPLILICSVLLLGASGKAIPDEVYSDSITGIGLSEAQRSSANTEGVNAEVSLTADGENEYTAKLFGLIPTKKVEGKLSSQLQLVPCGDVFGVKFFTKGVVVTALSEVESEEGIIGPAKKAGLKAGDVITFIDGKEINTAEELTEAVSSSSGKTLTVEFVRDEKSYKAKLTPVKALSDGKYKAGAWVRDSTAGIGTITFYNPEDGSFAGLGHGIYDSDTDLLLPLLRGAIVDITLDDIIKGRDGHPGELKGTFSTEKVGTLLGNTACGVYGVLAKAPETAYGAIPCALKNEVTEGSASILCNVDGRGVKEYTIEIVKIYSGAEETKNFVIEVTDEKLLSMTGGIVRGMSGSPIIQNGKLVGAVTHVLVNEPKRGYGIFIENMIDNIPENMTESE